MLRIPCVAGEADGGNRHAEGRGEPGEGAAEGIGQGDAGNRRLGKKKWTGGEVELANREKRNVKEKRGNGKGSEEREGRVDRKGEGRM